MNETVYYDGGCGLCHRLVRLALRIDTQAHFNFAPLGGETFAARVPPAAASLPDSVVIETTDGRLLTRSRAIQHIFRRCGWRTVAFALRVFPVAFEDWIYDFVAARRRRWFAPPAGSCPIVPQHLRSRFLP